MEGFEEEIQFLKCNYIRLNRSNSSIQNKAYRIGLKNKVKKWEEKEKLTLVKRYMEGVPLKTIAKLLNRSYNAIACRISILGLKRELINYNKNFFNVNSWSKELAWITGLIISDGHVGIHDNRYIVRLRMSDFDVINKVKQAVSFTGNINKCKGTNKSLFSVCFSYKYAWQFFTDLGMDNHKSYTAKWPIGLPDEYTNHFIRGVFDGDGGVRCNNGNYYPVSYICGTNNIIENIKNSVDVDSYIWKYSNNITYGIQFSGIRAHKFLNYIYKDSNKNIRMNRKYNIYKKTLRWKLKNKYQRRGDYG